jgi:hypothetical protein
MAADVPSEHMIYYFSKPGQPMHPGVIRRTFIQNKDGVSLQTEGWSFGPNSTQQASKQWLQAFRHRRAEIQARMRRRPGNPRGSIAKLVKGVRFTEEGGLVPPKKS